MPKTNMDSAPDAQAGDDLKQIHGIGPKKEPRLKAAGILTYADLGQRSPEELAAASGVAVKTIIERDWIGQAKRLAAPPLLRARVDKLTPIRGNLRSPTIPADEPAAARLMFRLMADDTPAAKSFDFNATIEAREYYDPRGRHPVGIEAGEVELSSSCTVEVTGDPLPPGLYKLLARVDIYPRGHGPAHKPLYTQEATGDLVQVGAAAE